MIRREYYFLCTKKGFKMGPLEYPLIDKKKSQRFILYTVRTENTDMIRISAMSIKFCIVVSILHFSNKKEISKLLQYHKMCIYQSMSA